MNAFFCKPREAARGQGSERMGHQGKVTPQVTLSFPPGRPPTLDPAPAPPKQRGTRNSWPGQMWNSLTSMFTSQPTVYWVNPHLVTECNQPPPPMNQYSAPPPPPPAPPAQRYSMPIPPPPSLQRPSALWHAAPPGNQQQMMMMDPLQMLQEQSHKGYYQSAKMGSTHQYPTSKAETNGFFPGRKVVNGYHPNTTMHPKCVYEMAKKDPEVFHSLVKEINKVYPNAKPKIEKEAHYPFREPDEFYWNAKTKIEKVPDSFQEPYKGEPYSQMPQGSSAKRELHSQMPLGSSSTGMLASQMPQGSSSKGVLASQMPQGSSSTGVLASQMPQGSSSTRVLASQMPQGSSSKGVLASQMPQGSSSKGVFINQGSSNSSLNGVRGTAIYCQPVSMEELYSQMPQGSSSKGELASQMPRGSSNTSFNGVGVTTPYHHPQPKTEPSMFSQTPKTPSWPSNSKPLNPNAQEWVPPAYMTTTMPATGNITISMPLVVGESMVEIPNHLYQDPYDCMSQPIIPYMLKEFEDLEKDVAGVGKDAGYPDSCVSYHHMSTPVIPYSAKDFQEVVDVPKEFDKVKKDVGKDDSYPNRPSLVSYHQRSAPVIPLKDAEDILEFEDLEKDVEGVRKDANFPNHPSLPYYQQSTPVIPYSAKDFKDVEDIHKEFEDLEKDVEGVRKDANYPTPSVPYYQHSTPVIPNSPKDFKDAEDASKDVCPPSDPSTTTSSLLEPSNIAPVVLYPPKDFSETKKDVEDIQQDVYLPSHPPSATSYLGTSSKSESAEESLRSAGRSSEVPDRVLESLESGEKGLSSVRISTEAPDMVLESTESDEKGVSSVGKSLDARVSVQESLDNTGMSYNAKGNLNTVKDQSNSAGESVSSSVSILESLNCAGKSYGAKKGLRSTEEELCRAEERLGDSCSVPESLEKTGRVVERTEKFNSASHMPESAEIHARVKERTDKCSSALEVPESAESYARVVERATPSPPPQPPPTQDLKYKGVEQPLPKIFQRDRTPPREPASPKVEARSIPEFFRRPTKSQRTQKRQFLRELKDSRQDAGDVGGVWRPVSSSPSSVSSSSSFSESPSSSFTTSSPSHVLPQCAPPMSSPTHAVTSSPVSISPLRCALSMSKSSSSSCESTDASVTTPSPSHAHTSSPVPISPLRCPLSMSRSSSLTSELSQSSNSSVASSPPSHTLSSPTRVLPSSPVPLSPIRCALSMSKSSPKAIPTSSSTHGSTKCSTESPRPRSESESSAASLDIDFVDEVDRVPTADIPSASSTPRKPVNRILACILGSGDSDTEEEDDWDDWDEVCVEDGKIPESHELDDSWETFGMGLVVVQCRKEPGKESQGSGDGSGKRTEAGLRCQNGLTAQGKAEGGDKRTEGSLRCLNGLVTPCKVERNDQGKEHKRKCQNGRTEQCGTEQNGTRTEGEIEDWRDLTPEYLVDLSFQCKTTPLTDLETDETTDEDEIEISDIAEINEKWDREVRQQVRGKSATRVSFGGSQVHPMVAWGHAYREARRGPWEQQARDRARFKERIGRLEMELSWVLQPSHRTEVYERLYGAATDAPTRTTATAIAPR